nr:G protein-coupled receptor [Proales similis]
METYPWFKVFLVAMHALNTVLSFAANLIVILSIRKHRELRNSPPFVLILNQAIAELVLGLTASPIIIFSFLLGKDYFDNNRIFCEIAASLIIGSSVTLLISLGVVGLNRYLFIFHISLYKRLFSLKRTKWICAGLWIFGVLSDLPSYSKHIFNESLNYCFLDPNNKVYFRVVFIFTGQIPWILNTYFYLRIYWHARSREYGRVRAIGRKLTPKHSSKKLLKTVFLSYLTHFICWIPGNATLASMYPVPKEITFLFALMAYSHASINPIILSLYNTRMRQAVKNLFARSTHT